ncbi:hypothetical protein [Streptomyces lydicus]|uniref:hypothetical protein n=1 Tax=Streptomyces lydicus TaxID=47763 RepID=UPI0036EFFCBB
MHIKIHPIPLCGPDQEKPAMDKIVKPQPDRETEPTVRPVPCAGDMNPIVQPTLDGEVPPARQQSDDYETWLTAVRPHFEKAAVTGRTFTTWEIADQHGLPNPPNPQAHWGRLMTLLKDEGWIRTAGWACTGRPTAHHSGVRTWRGTPAARRMTGEVA